MQFAHAFTELAAILLAAAVIGALGTFLRQPLIVSFIGVGVLVGPAGLGIVTQQEEVELLASIGIALLLFVVGLKLDVQMIRTVGPVALSTGLGQVIFTSVVGYVIAIALGYPPLEATYIAVALTFSSTIIIVKLLSDKREIDALHGRIAVGFLIVQDIVVILVMIALTAIGSGAGSEGVGLPQTAALVVVKGLLFLAAVVGLMKWVLPSVTRLLARSHELLVIASIAWAVALAAAGEAFGFSREVGAFLAGVSLASTPYREAIAGRLVTVRDFLLLFFFIDLGARLDLSLLGATVVPSLLFSAFVLIGNPLIVMIIMGALGYRKRTGFLAGLTVAQISEFSLILGALGVSLGHIDQETMGLITFVGLVTIGLSTYLILYSSQIYERLAPMLGVFERRTPYRESTVDAQVDDVPQADVILFGLGRYGGGIADHLRRRHRRVIGVDFDPAVLDRWRAAGLPVFYGDAEDPEIFEHLPLGRARWIVSTTPDLDSSRMLLRHLQDQHFGGKVAVTCRTPDEAAVLEREGADLILRPFADAAEQAADALTSAMDQLVAAAPDTVGLREVRLSAASPWAGLAIVDLPLRDQFGATVLAVSRSGRSVLSPPPGFQLFPYDRVILSGEPDTVGEAAAFLAQEHYTPEEADFAIEEWALAELPAWQGRTLADLHLRRRFGITVLGIRRPGRGVEPPTAQSTCAADDHVVVAGRREDLARARGPATAE
ncbi:MAG: cation:proton antiporter [Vicinamibacterales bacterium]|nr:cation:proton antiporter [Vicinamibacterales bacterium]